MILVKKIKGQNHVFLRVRAGKSEIGRKCENAKLLYNGECPLKKVDMTVWQNCFIMLLKGRHDCLAVTKAAKRSLAWANNAAPRNQVCKPFNKFIIHKRWWRWSISRIVTRIVWWSPPSHNFFEAFGTQPNMLLSLKDDFAFVLLY